MATTTILGDVVRNVVGDDGKVDVLLAPGVDPHEFQVSPRQAHRLAEADLVVANGLGLEGTLATVVAAAGGPVLELGPQLDPVRFDAGGRFDPHVWMDPLRMADAAILVADRLAGLYPDVDWRQRAASFAATLAGADAEIRDLLAAVPVGSRKLVTSHDALRYFADRYDLEVIGTVIPSAATLAAPSSTDLADLVDRMLAAGVAVIFAETTESAALSEAVAAEVGAQVVEVYTGSLGEPGSDAATYIGMLLVDARRIAGALVP